jgi:hypothetical protein
MDSNTIASAFDWYFMLFMMNPENKAMNALPLATSQPSQFPTVYDAITGQGNLQLAGNVTAITSSNVWITNVVANLTNGTMTTKFTIQGGSNGIPYDVFANYKLSFGVSGVPWVWLGQGYHGNTYMLTNMPGLDCFLILGTPQDTDGDGLTDAYELLVSKSNPTNADTNGSGIPDSWDVLLGLSPVINQLGQPGTRSNYAYTPADWLNQVSGARTGTIINDAEGNVLSVSQ